MKTLRCLVSVIAMMSPCLAEDGDQEDRFSHLIRIFVTGLVCEPSGLTWTAEDLGRLETTYLDPFDAPMVQKEKTWFEAVRTAKDIVVTPENCTAAMNEFRELPRLDVQ